MRLRRRRADQTADDSQLCANHYMRVLAAIVGKVGPVPVALSEYEQARPDQVSAVFVPDLDVDPEQPGPRDDPMVFVLPEHLTEGGVATMEQKITHVLEQHADDSLTDQARAVLTALGLPVNVRLDKAAGLTDEG